MSVTKRRGFTLIELVIVIVILGILSIVVAAKFTQVTDQAKLSTFEQNCKIVISSIGIYQASHDGDLPADMKELGTTIEGGWDSLQDNPSGATYVYSNGVFSGFYTDREGTLHTFKFPE